MKERSEPFSCFQIFSNQIRTQCVVAIKVFMSNNALKYKSFPVKPIFVKME